MSKGREWFVFFSVHHFKSEHESSITDLMDDILKHPSLHIT